MSTTDHSRERQKAVPCYDFTFPPPPAAFSAARAAAPKGRHSPFEAPRSPRDRCRRCWRGQPLGLGCWRIVAARPPAPRCPISQHGEHSRPAPFSAYRLPCWRSRSRPCGQRSIPVPPASPSHEDGQSAAAFSSTLHTTGSGGKLRRRDMLLGNITAEVQVKPCQPLLLRNVLCILPRSERLALYAPPLWVSSFPQRR